ncbi:uncharacterized protein LOC134690825 [Mytilus trossulus]|uniref:uncharacterized protein LOC134690825 n=1 Tax=Mytilus trossulus TaxID=6551 RepID=UPI003004FF05
MKYILLSLAVICILSVNGFSFKKRSDDDLNENERMLLQKLGVGMARWEFGEEGAEKAGHALENCLKNPKLEEVEDCMSENAKESIEECIADNNDKETCKQIEGLVEEMIVIGGFVYDSGCLNAENPPKCAHDECVPICEDMCDEENCDCDEGCSAIGGLLKEDDRSARLNRIRSMFKSRKFRNLSKRK